MKIILLSNDQELIKILSSYGKDSECKIFVFDTNEKPVTIVSNVLSLSPNLIIVDDDLLNPDTKSVLESIKKVNKNIEILFFTSNDSIDFGRRITKIGVNFYHIKPINKNDLEKLLWSFIKYKLIN